MDESSSEEGIAPAPLNPEASSSSGIRRSLFPPIWQRLKQHLQDPNDLPTSSGAHVTLTDLEMLAELRQAANAAYGPEPPPSLVEKDGKISGWVGTPDPAKHVAGTNVLTHSEVEEEVAKGNIVMLDDWVKEISQLELWEKRMLFESMLKEWMQNRMFVQTDNGAKVTFWDLFQYVHNNPELKALVQSRRTGFPMAGSSSSQEEGGSGELAEGLYGDPGNGMWRDLDLAAARQMPWGLVGVGEVWSRRPTRWLWGADAQKDVDFAMYVHQDKAHQLLGPKYSHKDPREVLADDNYVQDIMRAGPMMGMTFMLTAAREIPAQETYDTWTSRIANRLHERALRQQQQIPSSLSLTAAADEAGQQDSGSGMPVEALSASNAINTRLEKSIQALFDVYSMMDVDQLASETKIMDFSGKNLREGSSLIITTGADGKMVLQASSPGLARERQGYLLGAVENEDLVSALAEEFLGEDAVDLEFAASVPVNMLMYANGFKTDNIDNNPLMRRLDEGPGYKTEMIPAKANVFRLPRVGASLESGEVPPTLLSGVRERATVAALSDIFQRAYSAAEAIQLPERLPNPEGDQDADPASLELLKAKEEEVFAARKEAARSVFEQGLTTMGLNVQGLSFEELVGAGEPEPFDEEEIAVLTAMAEGRNKEGEGQAQTGKQSLYRARLG